MADNIGLVFNDLRDEVINRARKDFKRMVTEAYKEGIELMSGTLTQSQLNTMGNPYATDSWFPINKQTGKLLDSWKMKGSKDEFSIYFWEARAKYARYVIEGTSKMKARDVFKEILKRLPSKLAKLEE